MPLDNEFHLIYSDEKEQLKVNIEDLKKFKIRQAERHSVKSYKKIEARQEAKRHGYKLGRWIGTYAKIKTGGEGFFHLNTMTISQDRPGPQPKPTDA